MATIMHSIVWQAAFNSSNTSDCSAPHQYQWANQYLGECVKNDVQLTGMLLGLLSILCWMVAQSPQIYKNWRTSTAEGLSGLFLADWLAGDISNLAGCLLTNQVATQLYTAIWFCLIDTIMFTQWMYYEKCRKRPAKVYQVNTLAGGLILLLVCTAGVANWSVSAEQEETLARPGRVLLTIESFTDTRNIVGWSIGWLSGVLYFTSRIPQIIKNYRRKSTEGLSVAMFIMAIAGNVTYACGILMISVERDFIIDHIPWLLGSVGTMIFDIVIFCQSVYYGTDEEEVDNEKRPLLREV
eukprot:TRINITY_DN12184_c0_g1_i1.p2 TRINITY_DN12184_c0_g1~~TRINITY_DN12184_c0_g1_i1.p2  ORF type:complete len:297 (+),score=46.64 TRINITY_DN12184_c0_g1_i1:5175-6065(+)